MGWCFSWFDSGLNKSWLVLIMIKYVVSVSWIVFVVVLSVFGIKGIVGKYMFMLSDVSKLNGDNNNIVVVREYC